MSNRFYERYPNVASSATEIASADALTLLRSIPQYRADYTYELSSVLIDSVQPLCTSVTSARLEKAGRLIGMLTTARIPLFRPVEVVYDDATQLIFPPIIGVRPPHYRGLVLDGMHRLFAARRNGVRSVVVLCIRGAPERLPGTPLEWSDVSIVDYQPPAAHKFVNYDPAGFGDPYTVTFNDEVWWKSR